MSLEKSKQLIGAVIEATSQQKDCQHEMALAFQAFLEELAQEISQLRHQQSQLASGLDRLAKQQGR